MGRNKKYTTAEVKKYFADNGCELLEEEYVNSHTRMKYRCKCGNESVVNWNNFHQGKRCKKCATEKVIQSKKLSFDYVKNYFEEHGCELLERDYMNTNTLLRYRCSCGEESLKTFRDFQKHTRCAKCFRNNMSERFRFNFNYVKKYFEEQGCELLEDSYTNARVPIKYRCVCGKESKICFYSFKAGNRCKECGNKKSADKQTGRFRDGTELTHGLDYAMNFFAKHGCKLLEKRYIKSVAPMKFVCSCGNITQRSLNKFKKSPYCNRCGFARRSGVNNYQWRTDREQVRWEYEFRQRSYKLLKMVLNATGRVKNNRSAEMLGYDYKQLQRHVMEHPNWAVLRNKKWHLDHIFPIKAFLDYGIKDIKAINCLENLQPLSVKENCSKSAKYDKIEFEDWLRNKGVMWSK